MLLCGVVLFPITFDNTSTWCQKFDGQHILRAPRAVRLPSAQVNGPVGSNASGQSREDDRQQVRTFLYCLGEAADDVLTSTNISEEDRRHNVISNTPGSTDATSRRENCRSSTLPPSIARRDLQLRRCMR